jgi:hypothetical protein
MPLVLEITLILAFSRGTGRRKQRPFGANISGVVHLK